MKEKMKKILFNSIIVFVICFILLFLFLLYQDYEYYSVYDKEELLEFFSMKKTIFYNFRQALYWSIMQIIIYVPSLILLEKTKIKSVGKIIITLLLTLVVSFLFVLFNL